MTQRLQCSGRTLSPKITDDSHRALCHRQLRDCIISPSELMTGHEAKEDAPRGVLFGFQ